MPSPRPSSPPRSSAAFSPNRPKGLPGHGASQPTGDGRLRTRLVVAGLAIGVLAVSSAAVLVRLADAPALALSFWRCAAGALVLAPAALRSRRRVARLDRLQYRQILAAGLFLALHFSLWIASLSYTTVASAVVLVAMSPLFVGAGAALFLSEPPSRRTWAGIGVSFAGAVVVGLSDFSGADLGGTALFGDALAFAGAAAVAGYLLIGRAARPRLPVSVYATGVYTVAAAVLLLACVATGTDLGVGPSGYSLGTWLAIAGIVVGPQLLGHTVFNALLSTVTATVVAVVVVAEPVVSSALAYLVLGELPVPLFWAGAPLVLVGVWIAATHPQGPSGAATHPQAPSGAATHPQAPSGAPTHQQRDQAEARHAR